MNKKYFWIFMMLTGLGASFLTPIARAAAYDIKEMTPPVKAALDSRRARYDQLNAMKQQGVLGENNRGYVEVLIKDSSAQAMAKAENADRRVIYETVVEQNGLPASALSTVEAVFAEVLRSKAQPGDKYQTPDGKWMTK